MGDTPESENMVQAQGNRRNAAIALIIAIVLTLGIIVAAKVVQDKQASNPVALSSPDMPDNNAPECAELLGRLPERVDGLVRAELADPAPAGAAVWRDVEDHRITLRCGAPVPTQYNELAKTQNVDGVKWLRVVDAADENLVTWFAVGRSPVVAVTSDPTREDALKELAESLRPDTEFTKKPELSPIPLSDAKAPHNDKLCKSFIAALPKELGGRKLVDGLDVPDGMVVWSDDNGDIVSLRCGLEEPTSYADTTEQLTQVNDIVWFNEPTMSAGTTSAWYAMGRERYVAVDLPVSEGAQIMPLLSDIIASNLKNISPSEEK
ncbi:DUF3515 domain-containing protein [Corynebacterium sp. H113]|uniref:DUF3515 domain-containing protein n=1 Tax=Corynebacterium sp. H113 TaxID=3133419 RepID=UPI0030AFB678